MLTSQEAQVQPPSPSSSSNNSRSSSRSKSRQLRRPSKAPRLPQTRRSLQCLHAMRPPTVVHRAMRASPADRAVSVSSSTGARNLIGSTPSGPTYPVAYPQPTMVSSTSSLILKRRRQSACPSSSLGVRPVKRSSSRARMNPPRGRIRRSSNMSGCCFFCASTFYFVVFASLKIRCGDELIVFVPYRAARRCIPGNIYLL